mgnify:FL=1
MSVIQQMDMCILKEIVLVQNDTLCSLVDVVLNVFTLLSFNLLVISPHRTVAGQLLTIN